MHPAINPAIQTPTVGATAPDYVAHLEKIGHPLDWEGAGAPPWTDAREIVMGDFRSGYRGHLDWRPIVQTLLIQNTGISVSAAKKILDCGAPDDLVRTFASPNVSSVEHAPEGRCYNCRANNAWREECEHPEIEDLDNKLQGIGFGGEQPCRLWRPRVPNQAAAA